MPTSKAAKTKNKHRGSSFGSFLKKEGLYEEVHAAALKRAIAMKLDDLMRQKRVNKSTDGREDAYIARGDSSIARSREHVSHSRDA